VNYAFDEANRQVNAGGVTYDWDLNGNLLSDGNNTYTYDHANHLVGVSDGQSSATFAYNGLGDRLQQTVGGVTTQYTLDLNNSLTQVLSDGTNRYLYGMGRIAQQTPNGLQYFLPDALGSVRQLTGATGALALVQSFDPYGGLLSSQGSAATPYGFTGEWGDASGLIYLRARYYLPQAGIFTTRDPFPGFTTLPVTLQPYLYAAGNPLRYTDPSGEIIPFLVAAGLGGLISGGIDLGAQLLAMHPQSLSQALRCVNWGEVGIAFVGGAVAGLTGFTIFGATTALLGSGFFANLAAGTISGVVAGQYARLTGLVLSGQMSQIGKVLFQPQDLLLDSVLSGAFAGLGHGQVRSPGSGGDLSMPANVQKSIKFCINFSKSLD
jgi:RHS repeat-associated protein